MSDPHWVQLAAWLDRYNGHSIYPTVGLVNVTAIMAAAFLAFMMWPSNTDPQQKISFLVVVGMPVFLTVWHFRAAILPIPQNDTVLLISTKVTYYVDCLDYVIYIKPFIDWYSIMTIEIILALLMGLYFQETMKKLSRRRHAQHVDFSYEKYPFFLFLTALIMPFVAWAWHIFHVLGKLIAILHTLRLVRDIISWCFLDGTEKGNGTITIWKTTNPEILWKKLKDQPGMENNTYEGIVAGCNNKIERHNALLPYLEKYYVVKFSENY